MGGADPGDTPVVRFVGFGRGDFGRGDRDFRRASGFLAVGGGALGPGGPARRSGRIGQRH